MDIYALERALQTVMGEDRRRPLLAALADGGTVGVELSEEMKTAIGTLLQRSGGRVAGMERDSSAVPWY